MEFDDQPCCWICLGDDSADEELGALLQACACKSRRVHEKCLARWQLQSAGKAEESECRFCRERLPDWRPVLTPGKVQPTAVPVVSVHFNGRVYKLRVPPGEAGSEHFRRSLAKITGQPVLDAMQITFQCKAPDNTAHDLCFKGISAFNAAIHCASVSASERMKQPRRARSGDSSTSSNSSRSSSSSASSLQTAASTDSTSTDSDVDTAIAQSSGSVDGRVSVQGSAMSTINLPYDHQVSRFAPIVAERRRATSERDMTHIYRSALGPINQPAGITPPTAPAPEPPVTPDDSFPARLKHLFKWLFSSADETAASFEQ